MRSLDADPGKRGRQFERFVKWFLTNDPEWATQVAQVWPWENYPGRWGRDCGVDLVFKHKNGQTWVVQAKCYSPAYEITKSDVDKFLCETNRKGIDHRLLIATTDRLGSNAKQVCEAQEKPVIRYLRFQFDNAAVDYPDHISKLSLGKRKDPHDPYPCQEDAIKGVVSQVSRPPSVDNSSWLAAGKTFVSLWIKERLDANATAAQAMERVPKCEPFEVLCVCSDKTAGKRKKSDDEIISSVSDLAFPVTDRTRDSKEGDRTVPKRWWAPCDFFDISLELGAEIGKVDGIRPAKRDRGMVNRLGWVLYWACLVIAGAWAVFFLWWASVEPGVIGDIRGSPHLAVLMMAPFALLYGLGPVFRYVLSGE